MITRNLTNLGSEFSSLPNGVLSIQLVTEASIHPRIVDATTLEPISLPTTSQIVQLDSNGLFTVPLWPNDRGNITSFYLIKLDHYSINSRIYKVQIDSGATDKLWPDAILVGDPAPTGTSGSGDDMTITEVTSATQDTLPSDSTITAKRYLATSAVAITVYPPSGKQIMLQDGSYLTADTGLVSSSQIGDYIEMAQLSNGNWVVNDIRGTWSQV